MAHEEGGEDFIDMSQVMRKMRDKLLNTNLKCGFVFFNTGSNSSLGGGNFISNLVLRMNSTTPGGVVGGSKKLLSEVDQMNSITLSELEQDLSSGFIPKPLNTEEIRGCFNIYNNHPIVRSSSQTFKGELFKKNFKVEVGAGAAKHELRKELVEPIITQSWMPMMRNHYDWIKIVGVCPIFFEPYPLLTRGKGGGGGENKSLVIHFVPVIPEIGSGNIYVYHTKQDKQNYIWEWKRNTTEQVELFNFATTTTYQRSTGRKRRRNGEEVGGGGPIIIKKSRYMFFDAKIDKAPLLSGQLRSDIRSLLEDWTLLKYVERQDLIACYKLQNPEVIIEYSPDLENTKREGHFQLAKLHLDLMNTNVLAGTYDISNSYNETFGQFLDPTVNNGPFEKDRASFNNILNDAKLQNNRIGNMVSRVTEFAEYDLGLTGFNGQTAKHMGREGQHKEALEIMDILQGNESRDVKYPSNSKFLFPYQKISSAAPRVVAPNYNVQQMRETFNETASIVCDFPLELLRQRGLYGRESNMVNSLNSASLLTRMDVFKERVRTHKTHYQDLIQQLWIMAYSPFVEETIGVLRKVAEEERGKGRKRKKERRVLKKVEDEEEVEEEEDVSLVAYDILDSGIMDIFDNVSVTIPVLSFCDFNGALMLYRCGLMSTETMIEFLLDTYGVPSKEENLDFGKIERNMNEFIDAVILKKDSKEVEGGVKKKQKKSNNE